MGSVRFVDVPHKDKDGCPQLFELDPSIYGRIPANLLDEAVHFYNYPALGHYTAANDWPVFSKNRIQKAVPALYEVFKENIVRMVGRLYQTIPAHIDKEKCKNFRGWHSDLGVMCAKLMVSAECRNNQKVEELRKNAANVHFREFEKLIPGLGLLETRVERVENIYQEGYAGLIGGSEIRRALFEPTWGGSWLVQPKKELWESADRTWNPDEPVYPYDRPRVGPTEKLYFSLSADVFHKLHNIHFSRSRAHFSGTKDVFLQRVYGQSRIIRQIIPPGDPGDKRISIWRKWQRNLEHLAYIFEKAISDTWEDKRKHIRIKEAWIERHHEEYTTWIKEETDTCNIRVGFPAALGLIGILYAYITDIMARTLMSALSSAIIDIYEEINGYTAVGLYEALSGKGATAAVGPETVLDKELVGVLRQWRTIPVGEAQVGKKTWEGAEIEKWTRACFQQLLKNPLINVDRWEKTRSFKKQRTNIGKGLRFKDFYKSYIPRFPLITKDFYENLPLPAEHLHEEKGFNVDNWFADEKLYGATFESQVHIFAAFQLLERSKVILKWNWESKKYRFKEDRKVLKKKRHPCFFITAGSFVFGGRKPPHMTHRHGVNFDFIFGPDLISWPVAKISDYIVECKKDKKKKCKEWLKKFSDTNKRKRFLTKTWRPRAHVICYTKEQENKKVAQRVNRPHMVFRPLVRDEMVNPLAKEILKYCTQKNYNTLYYSEKEKDKYEEVEEKLTGTPHFICDNDAESLKIIPEERTELADWQRTHAGHLSILLSAPKLTVYGSPIIHFRALHATRQALKKEGLLVFEFECSDESIAYLNDPKKYKYQPSQGLLEIFFSSGIPLAPDHHIEIKSSNEWILINYGSEFRLNELDNYIHVSYLITNKLVAAFSDLITFTKFAFMPDNHHHHWHVDYSSNNLDRFRYLWLSIGVDLRGFVEYLSDYKINQHQLLNPVSEELKEIRTWSENYVEEFNQMYGEGKTADNDQQCQNRTILHILAEAIFGVYKNIDSPFLKPAIIFEKVSQSNQSNAQAQASEELKGQIKFSEKMIFDSGGLAQQFINNEIIGKEELILKLIEWGVNFVWEQEPLDIRRLMKEEYDEPELEDHEPSTE